MTRLGAQRQNLRSARGALERSWNDASGVWKDRRAHEYESRHQGQIERATRAFEAELERLDAEIGRALKRLPR